ncbi:MAG: sugar phosphate isomerase/epimerase [Oscillospiraceae bacterium]|nr:sugar phosphate isomerase/epimerase [Oscillospiraceae bacterium]
MKKRLLFATIAEDAPEAAQRFGLGVELSDFSYAPNMDPPLFEEKGPAARKKLRAAERHVFHAPFGEMCPASVDPLILEVVERRLEQGAALSRSLGIRRMVVHSGYIPRVYFKVWQHDRSVEFWKRFMDRQPEDFYIMVENVMDDTPEMIPDIVRDVNDPRVGVCLDVGHANVTSAVPIKDWIDAAAPFLTHLHLHNNDGVTDLHDSPGSGTLDIPWIMNYVNHICPEATMTLEVMRAMETGEWLRENGFLND